jgi:hypothetical protein
LAKCHPGLATIPVAHRKYLHQNIKIRYFDHGYTYPWLGKFKRNQRLVAKTMIIMVSGFLSPRLSYNSYSSYKISSPIYEDKIF